MRDLIDRGVEGLLVLLRGHAVAADLAHELERGGAHLFVRGLLFWSAESDDAAAHARQDKQGPSIAHLAHLAPDAANRGRSTLIRVADARRGSQIADSLGKPAAKGRC